MGEISLFRSKYQTIDHAIDHALHNFANATCESNWAIVGWVRCIFTRVRNWYNCRSTPACREVSRSPDLIKNVEQSEHGLQEEVIEWVFFQIQSEIYN